MATSADEYNDLDTTHARQKQRSASIRRMQHRTHRVGTPCRRSANKQWGVKQQLRQARDNRQELGPAGKNVAFRSGVSQPAFEVFRETHSPCHGIFEMIEHVLWSSHKNQANYATAT
jgi:hypothetical protein